MFQAYGAVYNTNTAMLLTANGTGFSLVQCEGIKILGGTQSLLQVSFFIIILVYFLVQYMTSVVYLIFVFIKFQVYLLTITSRFLIQKNAERSYLNI